MIRISLTAWFGDSEDRSVIAGRGIVGHMTKEQYEQAQEWLGKMAEWTDENRRKHEIQRTERSNQPTSGQA